ncbi:glutamate-1-semialdehyde 2,1-aminomutase [Canicola haemoglobinophilus]|nr:glutamate-1-semialdehyde 2,1-aminomutase [Canicola haemoglobinophilus]
MSKLIRNSTAEFLIFTNQTGDQSIEVRYEDNEIWLTQKRIAELFEVSLPTINEHLKHIFASEELNELSVIRNFRITASDGKNYNTKHYNLDAVISVGYRVNSVRATQFRQWATKVLREFSMKGYVLDRERMENGSFLGEDYFERLLEEIREIRLSERRFYQKITDIYATAVDYNKDAPTTKQFFCYCSKQTALRYSSTYCSGIDSGTSRQQ